MQVMKKSNMSEWFVRGLMRGDLVLREIGARVGESTSKPLASIPGIVLYPRGIWASRLSHLVRRP